MYVLIKVLGITDLHLNFFFVTEHHVRDCVESVIIHPPLQTVTVNAR